MKMAENKLSEYYLKLPETFYSHFFMYSNIIKVLLFLTLHNVA